jgi:hypothetical protein
MKDHRLNRGRNGAESPRALILARNNAPALYELAESIGRRVQGPRIGTLMLSGDLGAELVRASGWGSLLGQRTLIIGLPLLVALPRHQFRAVLARAMTDTRGVEGDRAAARATRRDDFAAALLRLRVIEQFLEERFYPQLLADVRRCGVPRSGMQARFESALTGLPAEPRFSAWVDAALQTQSESIADSGRPVRERLATLGLKNVRGDSVFLKQAFCDDTVDARATRYLRDTPGELILSAEKIWVDNVQRAWQDRHEELKRLDARRVELDHKPRLTYGEALEHVIATSETEGIDAAIQLARDLIGCRPNTPPARFVLGTLLLRKNDPEGLDHLEVALSGDEGLSEVGCEIACEFLRANGRDVEAMEFLARHGGPRLATGASAR